MCLQQFSSSGYFIFKTAFYRCYAVKSQGINTVYFLKWCGSACLNKPKYIERFWKYATNFQICMCGWSLASIQRCLTIVVISTTIREYLVGYWINTIVVMSTTIREYLVGYWINTIVVMSTTIREYLVGYWINTIVVMSTTIREYLVGYWINTIVVMSTTIREYLVGYWINTIVVISTTIR